MKERQIVIQWRPADGGKWFTSPHMQYNESDRPRAAALAEKMADASRNWQWRVQPPAEPKHRATRELLEEVA